nr:nodal modulator 1 [Onthophagus taurus]
MFNEKLVILCSLLLSYIICVTANDVLGCGGFIKSHVPIDFSKVVVKLLTKQGIVKDQTNCAPNNGYYFIPLYDKGEYILQLEPPPGWSFDPIRINVNIDGKNDICSQGHDINFKFKGFGITGKVESLGSSNGPLGIEVKLKTDSEVRITVTSENGLFFFTPVYPGLHTVVISHPKWKIIRDTVVVTVAEGNTELPAKSLIIAGYDVSGYVKSYGENIKGATLILYSEKNMNLKIEDCVQTPPDNIKIEDNYLCYVESDEKGFFSFSTVPIGKYRIVPFYRGQNIHFSPQSIEFTVEHNSYQLPQSFEIIGFSIFGRVLTSEGGRPLIDGTIYLNAEEVAKTDQNGIYALEKIKAGVYTLSVRADNYQFDQKTVKINPSISQLPEIYPASYLFCGHVISEQSQSVSITRIGSTQHFTIHTEPETGKFCEYLKPGKYQIQVLVNENDKQQGIQFFPVSHTVEISKKPLLDITFSQLKATVSGKVDCRRQKDCSSLKIILRPIINDVAQDEKDISMDIKGDTYIFTDIRPGMYEVLLTPNRLCWKQDKHIISITSTVLTVPTFIQVGYTIIFSSTHDAKISYKLPNRETSVLEIQQGRTLKCVESYGKYNFVLSSCHTYATNQIEYDTESENNEIVIVALKHHHNIGIKCNKDFGNITVKINVDGQKSISDPLTYKNNQYTLELYLSPQESAILIPESDVLYFNPPILLIEGSDDCKDMKDVFEAVKGRVFKGRVTPPLAGVQITVSSDNSETLMNETDSDGFYQFHPLDDSKQYQVTAAKDSYVLVGPDDQGNFMAHKLAEIIVEVIDQNNNLPLQGALLSLSGDQSYRSNLQTNEDGRIVFQSLSPSEYFLRPMMKEYSFDPSSKIIDVKEGATVHVTLKGRRVAYSVYGRVTSLNNEPEEKITVIASGLKNCSQYSEESSSESNGQFRIRGLLPYCSYNLQVKGDHFERAAPSVIELDAINKDIEDVKLVVFRQPQSIDILGRVFTANPEHYRSLRVKISRESSPAGLVSQTKIDTTGYKITEDYNNGVLIQLPSVPLDNKQYSVQLETTLPHYTKFKLPIEYFTANTSFKYVELNFAIKANVTDHNIKQTSVWTLLFIFLVMVAIYNIDKVLISVKEVVSKLNIDGIVNFKTRNQDKEYNNDNNDIDQIVQSINATKKKSKPKKI